MGPLARSVPSREVTWALSDNTPSCTASAPWPGDGGNSEGPAAP